MLPSAYDIREYYLSQQGQGVLHLLLKRFKHWWPDENLKGEYLMGTGYALPYLDACKGKPKTLALLSGQMGAMPWPVSGPQSDLRRCVLSDRSHWPIPNASLDYVLMIHELEYAQDPASVLDEAWRSLKPEGKLLLVVPNRTGLWARHEKTPFGHGRPFTTAQLYDLLRDQNYTLERMSGALLAPPFKHPSLTRHVAPCVEMLAPLCSALCGVLVVEASKRLYSPIKGTPQRVAKRAAWSVGTVPQG